MTTLVSVDCGSDSVDVAVFEDTILSHVCRQEGREDYELVEWLTIICHTWAPKTMVVEIPRIYQARFQKGDQNDLINVALTCGKVIGIVAEICPFCDIKTIYPREWKGNRKKTIDNRLTKRILQDNERTILDNAFRTIPKNKQHNILDAVGIGLHELGRSSHLGEGR